MSTRAPSVLERILAQTRERVEQRKREPGALAPAHDRPRLATGAFRRALLAPGIGVVAEFKRRSPSAGTLREDADVARILDAYQAGGAAAVSVLTEEANFAGSLADLRAARARCELPLLRKDFIVDPYQLHEARAAGADAALLIVAALAQEELIELQRVAREIGLETLVEVHDERELQAALAAGAEVVGINNRDLRDFSVDVRRTERLAPEVPDGVAIVSESGISSPQQLRALEQVGVHAVLVGESLMRAPDPRAALAGLLSL